MMRADWRGSDQVFLPSQLVEISQCFQMDVEDLRVLLQEEGLAVGRAECLEELSTRLSSDPRFRRDVAFLIRSMLGREQDGDESGEPGSMDVLGVLVVAAAGTRQEFGTPSRQNVVRELLRFVIQQRRPEAVAAVTGAEGQRREAPRSVSIKEPGLKPLDSRPHIQEHEDSWFLRKGESSRNGEDGVLLEPAEATVEDRAATPAPISARLATRREPLSPASPVVAPHPVAMPSLFRDEPESFPRRVAVVPIVALLAVLIAVGAGLLIWRANSKAGTRETPALATAPAAASPAYPAVSQTERRVIHPPSRGSARGSRKLLPPVTRATRRRMELTESSPPTKVAANRPPRTILRPEPLQPGPELNEPVSANAVPPVPPHHESATVPLPAGAAGQRSAQGSMDVSKAFAHPEAAVTEATNQVPPPAFHPKDPVLIPRNKAAMDGVQPEVQGTVHGGSAGSMVSNLMFSPDPEYPAEAIAAGVEGEVTVRAVVGPHGNVIDASVVSGPPLLREAALDAVGRWRYRPYEQDGKPMTVATTAIFDFQIPPKN